MSESFDVFLSHNSQDKPAVRQLAQALQKQGLRVWLDEWELVAGQPWQEALEEAIKTARTAAVLVGKDGLGPWEIPEMRACLLQFVKRHMPVIPVLLPDAPAQPELPLFIEALTWVDLRGGLTEDGLKRLERGIRFQPGPSRLTDEPPIVRTPKRICMISSEYPPRIYGGLGEHVKKLSTALGDYTEVDIVLPDNKKEYISLSKRVYPRAIADVKADYEDPTSWLRFAHHVPIKVGSLARPDVIHCHDWVTVLGGIKCRWMLRIPLLYHIHLPDTSPLCSSIENLGLLCADLVTVNSEFMQMKLFQRFMQENIRVVNNGVDTDNEFVPSKQWPADEGYILFVGRLVEQKGVEYLLRALLYVREKFPDIKLKIVGDGPYKDSLDMLARDLMISDQVSFLGWKDGPERVELYQAARLVVIPSVYEPFGITALEAMACQRPVVASRTGGLEKIVDDGINGFQFEPKDYLDLAQWIMTLLSNENLRREMGKKGREKACDRSYQWPSIARQYIDFYNSLSDKKDIDLTIPPRATEFKEQIFSMVKQMKPSLYNEPLLKGLFNWMEET